MNKNEVESQQTERRSINTLIIQSRQTKKNFSNLILQSKESALWESESEQRQIHEYMEGMIHVSSKGWLVDAEFPTDLWDIDSQPDSQKDSRWQSWISSYKRQAKQNAC